ncbi:hypothetical protein Bbelb_344170 [Branchiostoma belcheri]|nr:hypothetical protein Bbelb_344170 [Branchiostoma belcheri]
MSDVRPRCHTLYKCATPPLSRFPVWCHLHSHLLSRLQWWKTSRSFVIELILEGRNKPQCVNWPEGEPFPTRPLSGQHQENNGGQVQKWLRVKDKFVISDEGYHEIRMLSKATVPPLNRVIEERVRQNGMIAILTEANNNMARRSVKELLAHLLRHPKAQGKCQCRGHLCPVFRRWEAGDTKQQDWCSHGYSPDRPKPQHHQQGDGESPAAPYHIDEEASIFVYEGGEDHEVQRETAGMVYKEIEDIRKNGLTIDGKTVKVKWYLTADWKFLATLLGLNQASSKSFCLCCHCKKEEICDFDKPSWNIQRKRGDHNRFLGQREHKGHVLPSLVDFNFDEIVPDVLHMVVVWAINQRRTQELAAAMKDTGVPFRLMEGTGDDGKGSIRTWTQLNAGRKDALVKRLAEFLQSDQLPLPDEDEGNHAILIVDNIIKLWKDFEELALAMKAEPGSTGQLTPAMFQKKAREWWKFFRRVTFDEVMEYENRDLFAVLNDVISRQRMRSR